MPLAQLVNVKPPLARVVKLVDTRDLKSLGRKAIPVQVRSRVPYFAASSRLEKPPKGGFLFSDVKMGQFIPVFTAVFTAKDQFVRLK